MIPPCKNCQRIFSIHNSRLIGISKVWHVASFEPLNLWASLEQRSVAWQLGSDSGRGIDLGCVICPNMSLQSWEIPPCINTCVMNLLIAWIKMRIFNCPKRKDTNFFPESQRQKHVGKSSQLRNLCRHHRFGSVSEQRSQCGHHGKVSCSKGVDFTWLGVATGNLVNLQWCLYTLSTWCGVM